MMYRLQQLVMPNLTISASEDMYVRVFNDKVRILLVGKRLEFREGGRVSFDTFFNGFTVGKWRKNCTLNELYLVLVGRGRFVLRFGIHRLGHAHRWLGEQIIELEDDKELSISLGFWRGLDAGMLYFSVEALGSAELIGGYFATSTPPVNSVKLGIVITHFNRKQFVLPAMKRIRDDLLSDPLYEDKLELIVVDNSKNITREEGEGVTVIPNENLGGSGGFMCGLLYLKDRTEFTHCLFMDDDASCEVESIKRAYILHSYSQDNSISIAGALLRELEPWRLIDKGADFNGYPTCDKAGLDVRSVHDLLLAETDNKSPDFGGWWFLTFNISELRSFSFPFFVKCDDVLFGIMNKFPIVTLNGVACLSDDFGMKEGPLQRYLDTRGRLVMNLVYGNHSLRSCLMLLAKFSLAPLFSYNYASAQAANLGIKHVLIGPKFWVDNLDTSSIRSEISSFAGTEKMQILNRAKIEPTFKGLNETMLRKAVRVLTLNGFLLPSFLLKDDVAFQHKGFRGNFREIFRYKKVLYEYEPTGMGYVAEHNKKKFFGELALFSWQMVKFIVRFSALKREYQQALPDMTSESFWRKVYKAKE